MCCFFRLSLQLTLVGLHAAEIALLLFVLDVAAQSTQSIGVGGEWRLLLRFTITVRFVLDLCGEAAVL